MIEPRGKTRPVAADCVPARGVILDLDGTLADTLEDLAAAVNFAVGSAGFGPFEASQVRPMVGDGLAVLIARAAPSASDEDRAEMTRRFRAYYGEHFLDRTRLYPGWPDALDALTQRRIPLAVLSNKPDDFTRMIVDRLMSRWSLAAVLGQRPDLPLKPDPAAALELCSRLGLRPSEVLLVGDSPNDIETARRAGMRGVGVTWGFRSEKELRDAGAETLIHAPGELLSRLAETSPG